MPVRWRRVVSPPASLAMARRNCSALSWLAVPTSSVVVLMVPSSRISITSSLISILSPPPLHHGLPVPRRVGAPFELPAELACLALHRLLRVGTLELVHVTILGEFEAARSGIVRARYPVLPKKQ